MVDDDHQLDESLRIGIRSRSDQNIESKGTFCDSHAVLLAMLFFHSLIRAALSDLYPPRTAVVFPYGPVDITVSSSRTSAWGAYFPTALSLTPPGPSLNVTIPTSCKRLTISTRHPEHLELVALDDCLWYLSVEGDFTYTTDNLSDRATGYLEIFDGAPSHIALYSEFSGSASNLLIALADDVSQVSFKTNHSAKQWNQYNEFYENFTLIDSIHFFGEVPSETRTGTPSTTQPDEGHSWETYAGLSVGAVIVFAVIVFSISTFAFVCWLCWRGFVARRARWSQIAIEERDEEAIPAITLMPVEDLRPAGSAGEQSPDPEPNGYFQVVSA
jgi:hypothetical protein